MYRHISNVERIHTKLAARFGHDDELVLELKRELDRLNNMMSEPAGSSIHRTAFTKTTAPDKQNQYSH
jgi:hypothetical protein